MNKKLSKLFLSKQIKFLFLFLGVFIVTGLYTNYYVMTNAAFYYKWEPVIELNDNWYWYSDGNKEHDSLESHVLQQYHAVPVHAFRQERCRFVDSDDIGYDSFSQGVFFEISESDLEELKVLFPEAVKVQAVLEIVRWQYNILMERKYVIYGILVILWILSFAAGAFWFGKALEKSKEEQRYLSYVGNPTKRIKKRYCASLFKYLPVVYVISFAARLFPEPGEGFLGVYSAFWRIYPSVLVIMLIFFGLFFLGLYVVFAKVWNGKNHVDGQETERIYISDLTMQENLMLIFMAQGYSEKAAGKMAEVAIKNSGIDYCAKRKMGMCPGDEKLVFFKLQDELLGKLI